LIVRDPVPPTKSRDLDLTSHELIALPFDKTAWRNVRGRL